MLVCLSLYWNLAPEPRCAVTALMVGRRSIAVASSMVRAGLRLSGQVSSEPSVYLVELLFSFKGVKRVEVPEERIHAM